MPEHKETDQPTTTATETTSQPPQTQAEQYEVKQTINEVKDKSASSAEGDPAKLRQMLDAMSGSKPSESEPEKADDDPQDGAEAGEGAEVKPDSDSGEAAEAGDAEDGGAAENPFEGLEPDEVSALMEEFESFIKQRGQSATAPIQPEQAAEQAAEQQAAEQKQPTMQETTPLHQAVQIEPFTDEELLDADTFNAKLTKNLDGYAARIVQQTQQSTFQSMIPMVGLAIDTGIAVALAQERNPELVERGTELTALVAKARIANPNAPIGQVVETAAKQLARDAKTLEALKKMQARGLKIDGRTGTPPKGVQPSTTRPAAKAMKEENLSPLAQVLLRQGRASGAFKQ